MRRLRQFIAVGLKSPNVTGVVFSPCAKGYVSDKRASRVFSLGGLKAELFANSTELQHVAMALGPVGIRVAEGDLLAEVCAVRVERVPRATR